MLFVILSLFLTALASPINIFTSNELEHLQNDPTATHKVVLEISSKLLDEEANQVTTEILGSLTLALFGSTAPKTVENFAALANMTYGYGYVDSKFHRIVKDFVVQGGDFDGQGGRSIYGSKFDDETFALTHNKLGRLSMANAGSNTNGAQFFIATNTELNWLDGHHVVFGQLVSGFDVLSRMNEVEVGANDKPVADVVISKADVWTLFDTAVLVDSQKNPVLDTPETVEYIGPTTNYNFLVSFIVVLFIVYMAKRVYFRRQYVIDIKDANFF